MPGKPWGNPDFLVLDEAQRVPEAARIVKGWIDAKSPMKFLLLGSSSLDLLDQSAESLTGRKRKLPLPPLVFAETLRIREWYSTSIPRPVLLETHAKALRAALLESMVFGGYPEVVTTTDKAGLLRELSSDYLWKDIVQEGLVKSPATLRRLLLLLAHQAGAAVSIHELAQQLQMARPTVERYLDLLEQTFVIFRLPSFSTNPRKEVAKSRKIFFWDTGIRNALLNSFDPSAMRPDIGQLWENWVVAEAAKWNLLTGGEAELFFWRNREQAEVDLVVRRGGKLRAFEIKWGRKRVSGLAFRHAYQIQVEPLTPQNPFMDGVVK